MVEAGDGAWLIACGLLDGVCDSAHVGAAALLDIHALSALGISEDNI